MTSVPPPAPIDCFQAALDGGYSVLVADSTSNHEFLRTAPRGSAMWTVFTGKAVVMRQHQDGKCSLLLTIVDQICC